MLRRVVLIFTVLVLFAFQVATGAQSTASLVLTYTGRNFDSVYGTGPVATSNHLTISLTFANVPIVDGNIGIYSVGYYTNGYSPYELPDLTAWSISDGVHTLSNSNTLLFDGGFSALVSLSGQLTLFGGWSLSATSSPTGPNFLTLGSESGVLGFNGDFSQSAYPNGGNNAKTSMLGTWTATVTVSSPLMVTTKALPDAVSGQPYTQTLAATGGVSPISWSLAPGSALPAGFNFSPAGVLSSKGTPDAPLIDKNLTDSFTVVATDSAGNTAQQQLSLTVRAQVELPHYPASLEGTIKAHYLGSGTDTTINFYNQLSQPINIYWLDYSGNRVLVGSNIPPGGNTGVYTFFTHPFLITDASGVGLFIVVPYSKAPDTSGGWKATAGVNNAAVAIRVDANRDGLISFADNTDQTTPASPFPFWVDSDRVEIDSAGAQVTGDPDPKQGPPDSTLTTIPYTRDLDNFLRVQIKAPDGFKPNNPAWTCTLSFTQITSGQPAIRVFHAVTPGSEYLSSVSVASRQINPLLNPELALVTGDGRESPIPLSAFANPGNTAALLFDGVAQGQGALTVSIYKNGTKVDQDFVYLNLKPITTMYDHWTVGDTEALTGWPTDLMRVPNEVADPVVGQTPDYIVFVHGWRLHIWERRAFAQSAFKRLWHLGYKGGFALFSWPTEWKPSGLLPALVDRQNYDRSEEKAWNSAKGLHQLLSNLQATHPGHVYMFAHSMGNIVASEALRIEAETTTSTNLVQVYVASQAASVANAYNQSLLPTTVRSPLDVYGYFPPANNQPYFAGTMGRSLLWAAGKLVNFYNAQDYALGGWDYNQRLKPDKGWSYSSGDSRPGHHTQPGYYRAGSPSNILLDYQEDRYKIFSYAAPAHTRALGATANVGGPFITDKKVNQVNLNAPPYKFGSSSAGHSAEFTGSMVARFAYWQTLLTTFGLQPNKI